MPSRRGLLAGAVGAAVIPAGAAALRDSLLSYLTVQQAAGAFPGAALAVAYQDRPVLTHCLGTYRAPRGEDRELQPAVLHPLYSFSKLISATVIATLVAERRLEWDRPIREYVPGFTGGGKDGITLRHLLTHSAGLPTVPLGWVRTEEEWRTAVAAIGAARTEWEPGSRSAYHALTGLFVAAEAARRVSGGKSWEEICRERLFGPLGARTLSFAAPREGARFALSPQPESAPGSAGEWWQLAGHPGGGCVGTVADALRVVRLHVNRGVWRGRRLLPEAVWREMHTVQYRREIAAARAAGRPPGYDPMGLGPLLRGEGPATGAHQWFGFANLGTPTVFGHAGVDTVAGVGEPQARWALFFATTGSPRPEGKAPELRNGVTDRVAAALLGPAAGVSA